MGYKGLLIKPQPFFTVWCHQGLFFVILDSTIDQDTDNSEKAIAGKYNSSGLRLPLRKASVAPTGSTILESQF